MQETPVQFLGWEDPLEKGRLPTPVFWPGEFHGLYSPRGHKEWDMKATFTLIGNSNNQSSVDLNRKEIQKRRDIYIYTHTYTHTHPHTHTHTHKHTADSLCCTQETNTTLQSNAPRKINKKEKGKISLQDKLTNLLFNCIIKIAKKREHRAGRRFFNISVRNGMRKTHFTRFSNFVKIMSAVKSTTGMLKQ